MQKYNHQKVEKDWQDYWVKKKTFIAKDFSKKPKKYVLVEFPYPSGAGLHMGHLRPYVAADVYARFSRLKGFETLLPIGWDAFGLPAENYAIKMGVHPTKTTASNIKNAKRQLQSWGLSFDWSREINTTDPTYYKWTQWLFLQFYKKGLAYESTGLINWCPKDKTGLANEEVIDGKCERCGTIVEKKELRQWYLKITEYAEKLLGGLKELPEWPEAVKLQQENWIGKKTGINITYNLDVKRNYVIIHGFTATPESDFHPWLKRELESRGHSVQIPSLPNTEKPSEEEQVDFVLKNCSFDEHTILVGHSLGSVVAMKVLEKLQTKISGLVIVGGFLSPNFKDHDRNFAKRFTWNFDFENIRASVGNVTILHDVNDSAILDSSADMLSESFASPVIKCNPKEDHFTGTEEWVILEHLLPQVTVFTTRPDTNFGATFVVIGPEHPLIENQKILSLESSVWKKIEAYKKKSLEIQDQDRIAEKRKKTGVFTGLYAINGLNGYKLPLYVADYVLGNVGTGAVVGVPAHDKRDFEFAQQFEIPIVRVVQKDEHDTGEIDDISKVQEEDGYMVNSGFLNGMPIHEATEKIMDFLEEKGFGKRVVNYKLRDWVFSRQRYWGEPIPIIHCPHCGVVPVPEKDLPVTLPPVKKYEPTGTGESPLAAISKWVNTYCPQCKQKAKRETNTMPQWAGSSWYWLRYTDVKNNKKFADIKKLHYWTPVDVYFGGMEHTTLHLLYSRFWNLFLADQGLVAAREPYAMRKPHGIILGPDGEKMSKSRGNVVNPDDIVKKHGADTLRMYELFLGPHDAMVSWNDQGILGVRRFLERMWYWVYDIVEAPHKKLENSQDKISDSEKVERALHKLIKKVTDDFESFRFNTTVSSFMEFHNEVKNEFITLESLKKVLILLYPLAPHIAEELGSVVDLAYHKQIGKKGKFQSLQYEKWPEFDESKMSVSVSEVVVQVNGKVKGKVSVPFGSSQEAAYAEAVKIVSVAEILKVDTVKRVVYVPNKLLNLVV